MNINNAKAASLLERGNIQNHGIFTKEGLVERGGSWQEIKGFVDQWSEIGNTLSNGIHFINQLPENMPIYSVQLLSKIYELLTTTVLYTPLFIFNNSLIKDTSLVLAGVSILLVTILTMVEGIKKMLKKKNTDVKKILSRYLLAITGAGFSPFLFEKSFQLINSLTKAISQIGSHKISQFNIFSSADSVLGFINNGFMETTLLIVFDAIVLALLIPIILQTGRRWWDLLCLSSLTPLSLSAWIFDDYKHYFDKWWANIKLLAQTQLIYAIYICLMGVFIFGTAGVVTGSGLIAKMLIIIGGLMRMSNPPAFIRAKVDTGDDMEDVGINFYKTMKDVYDTVSLKKLRSMKYLKGKLSK